MSKVKFTLILVVLISILLVVPSSFAEDNQTALELASNENEVVSSDYYFDANLENDTGHGTEYNPYKELTFNRLKDNSNIYLSNGEYNFKTSKSIKNVTIIGEDSSKTIVYGKSFTAYSSVTFKNLTFVGLNIVNKGNISAENVNFISSSNHNSIISSVENNTYINLKNCTFKDNDADYGAAIYIINGNLNISNSNFENNYANIFGGAIFSLNSYLTIDKSLFKKNNASYDGGSIYVYGRSVSLLNSIFENNFARNGGGIFASGIESFLVKSNKFNSNYAIDKGNAVYSILNEIFYNSLENISLNNSFINNTIYELDLTTNIFIGDNDYILIKYNSTSNDDLPDRYDLRDYGYVTSVKNQGDGGNCWSFAAISALESSILKGTGYNFDLSEENMKNLMSLYSIYGWTMEPNTGGYDDMGVGYLVSWLGPVNESDNRYNPTSIISPVLNSFIHVQNIQFLTRSDYLDNYAIKKAIYDYGGVATSIFWKTDFRNGINYYYYGNSSGSNHAVTIVGWDDNYSRYNFNKTVDGATPKGDGAWIIKNSWGTNTGDKGFFYVSYYDTRIATVNKTDVSYVIILNDIIKYDKNYQYDIPGKTDYFFNETNTVWYKNRFTSTDNEYLTAVSTYFDKQTSWNLSVYVNDVLKHTQSGQSQPSYSTIQLDQFIPLKKGDVFEIVFEIVVDKEAGVPVCEEVSLNNLLFTNNISFISYDGLNWNDIYDLVWQYSSHTYNMNGVSVACIKAFTILNPINTNIVLDVISHDDFVDIIATVYNEYGNIVPSGTITFNDDVSVDVVNGVAEYSNIAILPGINTFSVKFDSIGYVSFSKNIFYQSKLINTNIKINHSNLDFNPIEIFVSVLDEKNNFVKSGWITVTIENVNYTVQLVEGVGKIQYQFKNNGLNNISVYYFDDYCYKNSSLNSTLNINLKETSINLSVENENNPIKITATVKDDEGNLVNSGNVSFILDDSVYIVSVVNGIAQFEHIFTEIGVNNVRAIYHDLNNYLSSNSAIDFNVKLIKSKIDIEIVSEKNPIYINAKIYDINNNCINEGTVTFNVDSKLYTVNVVNGTASFKHTFAQTGIKSVTVSYSGSNIYDYSITNEKLNVSKTIINLSLNISKYFNNVTINAVTSENIDGNVMLYLNDEYYNLKLRNGFASINISNLEIGEYNIKSKVYSNIYYSEEVFENITFKSIILTEISNFAYNSFYEAILLDKNTQPLKNKVVNINIDGTKYVVKTDMNGKISYNILFTPGTYIINIINPITKDWINQKIKVVKRITSNSNLVMYYGAGKEYKVRVCDDNGKYVKCLKVTFAVNKKTYTRYTDANGYVSLKIGLNPGTYTIKATYNGYSVSNKVTVKPTLVMSAKTVKKSKTFKYTVKLLSSSGKILKSKKITVKFKGKTYKAKTNSKGIATFKIKSYTKLGKFTLTASYGSAKISKKITVKK